MKKNIVIETLNSFDDEFDTEKLIEKLLFIEKVEKGMKDVEESKINSIPILNQVNRFPK